MQLTIGTSYDLYTALSRLEEGKEIKLGGECRLKIAINLNVLRPGAEAFERARSRSIADMLAENRALASELRRSEAEMSADALEMVYVMREQTVDVALRPLLKAEINLDANPAISGAMMALLQPILPDLDG